MDVTQQLLDKARAIQCLILDVDGILTDGRLYYSDQGETLKTFHVHDGQGIKNLQNAGISVAIISSRNSQMVAKRAEELGIHTVFQGIHDKLSAFKELQNSIALPSTHYAYMGDDLVDLPVMQEVGLSFTVPNAIAAVKKAADWTTEQPGGFGAVREVADFILESQIHA